MTEEKQIEEMAKAIDDIASNAYIENYDEAIADADKIAEALYNAGYRKQSEGEWGFDGMSWTCSECNEYATKGIRTSFCPNCGAGMKGGAE